MNDPLYNQDHPKVSNTCLGEIACVIDVILNTSIRFEVNNLEKNKDGLLQKSKCDSPSRLYAANIFAKLQNR